MQELVSILIPVYNRQEFIEETINSALGQTYQNIEIVVVDNCSTDGTWEKLKKISENESKVKVFRNEKNIGPVKNWRKCIEYAKGKYGKILWSDDLIDPTFLEDTVPFLADESVGFVFTGTEIFGYENNHRRDDYFIGETGEYKTEEYINGVLCNLNVPFSPGCALFRLKDIDKNLLVNIPNKIDCDFSQHAIGNDLLLYLMVAHQYSCFAFVNKKLSFFRHHKDSISVSSEKQKMRLYYLLATAFFVEKYRPDLTEKLNSDIKYKIYRSKRRSKELHLFKIENFYLNNTNHRVDYCFLMSNLLKKIIRKLFSINLKKRKRMKITSIKIKQHHR